MEERFIDIEQSLMFQQKMLDELNDVVILQGKEIDGLKKQIKFLEEKVSAETVKPLSEETPPPHY